MGEERAKRRTPEEIIGLIYEALESDKGEKIFTVTDIAELAGIDRDTCSRHLSYIATVESQQNGNWLEVMDHLSGDRKAYRKIKAGRKR